MAGTHGVPAILLLLGMLVACGQRKEQGSAVPADRSGPSQQLEGRVFVTGQESASGATLVTENGQSVSLLGDLEPELRRLSGATIRIDGTQTDRGPGRSLEVHDYMVLSIDGEQPAVGFLVDAHGRLALAGRDTVELGSVPEDLRNQEGSKVWIVGPRAGGKLDIRSFGILREAGR